MSDPQRIGPYRAEFGAIYHEDSVNYLFLVVGDGAADEVARALNLAHLFATRQLEALEKDAARYRYLRDRDPAPLGAPIPPGLFVGQVPENLILTGEDADRAIDAAQAMKLITDEALKNIGRPLHVPSTYT